MSEDLITSTPILEKTLGAIKQESIYGIDTEFMGEGNYSPRLGLIQLSYRKEGQNRAVLVDPEAVNLEALADFFRQPVLAVMHSCAQDITLLKTYCGAVPFRIFDTQIAAGFLGMGHPSLEEVVFNCLGKSLQKGVRLTDWLARPLTKQQTKYAKEDVVHLIQVYEKMSRELDKRGRAAWAEAEFESIRVSRQNLENPEESWKSIKKIHTLKGGDLELARDLSGWREDKAKAANRPRQKILSDLAILIISQARPKNAAELKNMRGVNRSVSGSRNTTNAILEIIEANTRKMPKPEVPFEGRGGGEADPPEIQPAASRKQPLVSLLISWLNAYAMSLDIYPSLLATRNDILDYFSEPPAGRLTEGWRAQLLGDTLKRIAAGETAVAVSIAGELILEERSNRAFEL